MKKILFGFAFLCTMAAMQAGEPLQIKFISRGMLDAAVSGYGTESTQGYYRLEDLRGGFKMTYGRYELKAEVGFGAGKVAIKDLLFNYHFKNSVLALGNTYEPFSLGMIISTGSLRFNQPAASVLAFTDSRKLGLTYHYHTPHWYAATGLYTHNDINKLGSEQKNAFISTSRFAWRNQDDFYHLLHFGAGFSFRSKAVNTDGPVTGTVVSNGVTSMFPHPLLKAEIPNMGTELKGVIEALYTSPRFLIQAEYFLNRLNRTDGQPAYRPHGGYVQGSFLLKGKGFKYNSVYAIQGRPASDRAIELTARFNYTDMNDKDAQIMGGREKDFSLGVNFYLNQYLCLKVNGSYVWVGKHCNEFYQGNFFLPQMRLQYVL